MTDLSPENARRLITDAITEVAPDVADELATLPPGADVFEDLELDSMDHVNIMNGIFERTGVEIAERDYATLRTIDTLTDFVSRAATSPPVQPPTHRASTSQ